MGTATGGGGCGGTLLSAAFPQGVGDSSDASA